MKRALLFLTFIMVAVGGYAQCEPDPLFQDSSIGVYPPPYKEDRPNSGIQDTACINEFFDYTITVKVPPTITYNALEFGLNSVSMETTGAVHDLPEGLSYACNPPNCEFSPDGDLGCVNIFGTPTNPDDAGIKDLTLDVKIDVAILGELELTLPDNSGLVAGADGNYFLFIKSEEACDLTTSTVELAIAPLQIKNAPNPFADATVIEVNSTAAGDFTLDVFDILGHRVRSEQVSLRVGLNRIDFQADHLSNGIYTYILFDGKNSVAAKMIVQR